MNTEVKKIIRAMPRSAAISQACYRPVSCMVHTESASLGNWLAVSPERQSSFLTELTAYVYTPMIAHLLIF